MLLQEVLGTCTHLVAIGPVAVEDCKQELVPQTVHVRQHQPGVLAFRLRPAVFGAWTRLVSTAQNVVAQRKLSGLAERQRWKPPAEVG